MATAEQHEELVEALNGIVAELTAVYEQLVRIANK